MKEHNLELINMTKIKEQALSQSRKAEGIYKNILFNYLDSIYIKIIIIIDRK